MVGQGKRVLEIGAGPGSMTRVLRDKYRCRVTAIEIDNEVIPQLEAVAERVPQLGGAGRIERQRHLRHIDASLEIAQRER